jgi:hypothetical protein
MSRAVERLAKDRERHVSIVKATLEQALHDVYGVIDSTRSHRRRRGAGRSGASMTADLSGLDTLIKSAKRREQAEGGLPHGEHPYDYGYGYFELPPQLVVALAEAAKDAALLVDRSIDIEEVERRERQLIESLAAVEAALKGDSELDAG